MRVSEKTIEVNFCAEVTVQLAPYFRVTWFGLTQEQEARWGFDVCSKLGARLIFLQFKAPDYTMKTGTYKGYLRFHANHDQMERLLRIARPARSVYYVFPMLGDTLGFARAANLLSACELVDVATLPNPVPMPLARRGPPRRIADHAVYVRPGLATFHSSPFEVATVNGTRLFGASPSGARSTETASAGMSATTPGLLENFLDSGVLVENLRTLGEFLDLVGGISPGLFALGLSRRTK